MKIIRRAAPRLRVDDVAYFNADQMGPATWSYVCWLDVMGMRSRMAWSDAISANGIFKLYNAAIRARGKAGHPSKFRLYPVMDGAFLTAEEWHELADVVRETMRLYAGAFVRTTNNAFRFMIRGGVSYGPVYHGKDLKPEADWYLAEHADIRDAIVIGRPVLDAYSAERDAPPFGISIDANVARRFETDEDKDASVDAKKLVYCWHLKAGEVASELPTAIVEYYEWYKRHGKDSEYPPAERSAHLKKAMTYFREKRGRS